VNGRRNITVFLTLLAVILVAGCGGYATKSTPPDDLFNLAHLEHLSSGASIQEVPVRIVSIYAEAPDYVWIADEDEGATCLDDIARAARLYMERYRRTGDESLLRPAKEMLNYAIAMQTPDGEFYNFMFPDGRINKGHVNSVKSFGWWAARGFRSLAIGASLFSDVDPEFGEQLKKTVEVSVNRLRTLDPATARGDREIGQDVSAVIVLGLLEWYQLTGDETVVPIIERHVDWVLKGRFDGSDAFPYVIHKPWRNIWHAWGQLQVEALTRAGMILDREEWIESARAEAETWYRWLVCEGPIVYFVLEDGDTTDVRRYSQIAYDLNNLVQGNTALYEATGDTTFAVAAGLAARWFMGDNDANLPLYDPKTGRGYDGLIGPGEINWNSGAESTIEALLALESLARLPLTDRTINLKKMGLVDGSYEFVNGGMHVTVTPGTTETRNWKIDWKK